MRLAQTFAIAALWACGVAWLPTAAAFDFSGEKTLVARFRDGGQLPLGRIMA